MNATMNEWEWACDNCVMIHAEETTCEEASEWSACGACGEYNNGEHNCSEEANQ